MYCRPSDVGIWFTVCLMRHLILVFTNFYYMKLTSKGKYLILISILSDY